MKNIILTGDRPTGPLHLGHFIGSLLNRVKLQGAYQQFIMIADMQALTDHIDNPRYVATNVEEVCKDYLAVGIDPAQTTIFIQSQIPALAEMTMYFLNLVTLGRLERNPTVKMEIQQKGFGDHLPVGFLCYPVSQAADITAFKADIIPVGDDQLPMIEQTNEIVRRFNRIYQTTCLKEVKPLLSATPRLVGLNGKAKASKSLNNAIFLCDTPQEIKRKIMSMFTDPDHLRISDPGKVEGNVVFSYLDAFHNDPQEVEHLKNHYRRGGLGDTSIKELLNKVLQDLLVPITERRQMINSDQVRAILTHGHSVANTIASQTLKEMKEAMGIGY